MSLVYNLQDLISLAINLSFFTKIELFKNREKYEKGLLTEESTVVCEPNEVYVKVEDFMDILNSSSFSDSTKKDIKLKLSKLPTKTINLDDCVIVTSLSQLRALF
jgi:hypothetical protein